MSIVFSYKTYWNGRRYAYIVENFRDPATNCLASRTLECFGQPMGDHKARDKVEERLEQYHSDPDLYKEAVIEGVTKETMFSNPVNPEELSPPFSLAMAPFLRLWEELGLNNYFKSMQKDLTLPFDVNKYASYLALKQLISPSSILDSWRLANLSAFDYRGLKLSKVYLLLNELQKEKIQTLNFLNKIGKMPNTKKVNLLLCNLTPLYFENLEETGKEKVTGYEVDDKREPQLIVGVVMTKDGYLRDFSLFPDKTQDRQTMMEFIEEFRNKFGSSMTVIADEYTGKLLDLNKLQEKGYRYIVCNSTQLDYPGIREFFKKCSTYIEKHRFRNEWEEQDYWDNIVEEEEEEEAHEAYAVRMWKFKEATPSLKSAKGTEEDASPKDRQPRIIEVFSRARHPYDFDKLNESFYTLKKTGVFQEKDSDSIYHAKRVLDAGFRTIYTNLSRTAKSNELIAKGLKQLWGIEKDFQFPNTRAGFLYTPEHIEGLIVASYVAIILEKVFAKTLYENGMSLTTEEAVDLLLGAFIEPVEASENDKTRLLHTCYTAKRKNISKKLKKRGHASMRSLCWDVLWVMDIDSLQRNETDESLKKKLGINQPLRLELTYEGTDSSPMPEMNPSTETELP